MSRVEGFIVSPLSEASLVSIRVIDPFATPCHLRCFESSCLVSVDMPASYDDVTTVPNDHIAIVEVAQSFLDSKLQRAYSSAELGPQITNESVRF